MRRWLEFDARMRAIAWQCAGHGVEGRKRAADAGVVFQRVETGIDREGCVLEVVAELHALVIKRVEIAKRSIPVDAVHAQTHAAAFAADKPAVRKIVAHRGKAAASGVTAVKARKVAVRVRTLADGWIAREADGPARDPISHSGGLGGGGSAAWIERRQYQCET